MNTELCITFDTSGVGHCLYSEAVDLPQIGRMSIRRATNIEYDNDGQVWRVHDNHGLPIYVSPSRQICLDWERRYFNNG